MRARIAHPALAGLGTRLGRRLPGKASATPEWLAGYNAALTACCLEGARILRQSEPRGLQSDYISGWRSAVLLARALGLRTLAARGEAPSP